MLSGRAGILATRQDSDELHYEGHEEGNAAAAAARFFVLFVIRILSEIRESTARVRPVRQGEAGRIYACLPPHRLIQPPLPTRNPITFAAIIGAARSIFPRWKKRWENR